MKGKEAQQWIKPIAWGVGLYIGYKYVVSPLLETFNLKDTEEEKIIQDQNVKPSSVNPFDPNYKNITPAAAKGGGRYLIPNSVINKYLTDLWDSQPLYWPLIRPKRYEMAAGVIRDIKYKTQISDLADYFKKKYKQDLYAFLKTNFSDKEVVALTQLVNGKPSGFLTPKGEIIK